VRDIAAADDMMARESHTTPLLCREVVRENRVNQSGSVALSTEAMRGPPWRNLQAIACQYGSRSTISLSGDTQFCDDNWCPGKVAIITMRAPQLCSRAEGSPSVNTASGSVAHFSVGKTQKGAGPLVVSNGARGKAAGLLQPTIRSLAHSAT
jgi:hypothetical protein